MSETKAQHAKRMELADAIRQLGMLAGRSDITAIADQLGGSDLDVARASLRTWRHVPHIPPSEDIRQCVALDEALERLMVVHAEFRALCPGAAQSRS
jgi:hypothetical protein